MSQCPVARLIGTHLDDVLRGDLCVCVVCVCVGGGGGGLSVQYICHLVPDDDGSSHRRQFTACLGDLLQHPLKSISP